LTSWIEVYRCRQYPQGQEFALVLVALGIDHRVERQDDAYRLLVAPEDAARARSELGEYEAETKASSPLERESPKGIGRLRDALGYWSVLLVFHGLEHYRAFGLDWLQAGKAHALLIHQGEWWRTVTALTLHADGSHLLHNLVFGALFGILLGHELGMGVAWCSILLAGAVGNGINAWWHAPGHMSIGASTAIFSALGLLLALQWRRYDPLRQHRLRRWAPPVIGAVLLGFLGTSGERTDVLAHVTGMGSGAVFGLVFNLFLRQPPLAGPYQMALGGATLVLLAVSWAYAFS
jgi:membrane associated rhomboid family serine protease